MSHNTASAPAPPPLKRYFTNDAAVSAASSDSFRTINARDEIQKGLKKLVTKYPPSTSSFLADPASFGFFGGACSVAYLFFRLASEPGSWSSEVRVEGKSCADWARSYLDIAPKVIEERKAASNTQDDQDLPTNRYCGPANEKLSFHALSAAMAEDEKEKERHVQEVLAVVPGVLEKGGDINVNPEEEGGWNEYLYGRAGYLFLLRFIRHFVSESAIPATTFTSVIDMMLSEGPTAGEPNCWRWVESPAIYLGAGHGWAGITMQILLSDPSYADHLLPVVKDIISWQFENGNWPKFVPGTNPDGYDGDNFIQWGHGAPGVVISLMSIRPAYAHTPDVQTAIDQAIAKAQGIIWERGLLRKESCLCHGAAGNAIALTDRKQMEHFLSHSIEEAVENGLADGSLEASSFASGIHRGLASRIFALHTYERGEVGKYATYNDI